MTNHWKTLVTAIVLSGAISTIATADGYEYGPGSKGFASPAWTWTGFYVGLNAGGVWADADDRWTPNPPGFSPAAFPIAIAATGTGSIDTSGFTGGGQIGFNYQSGLVVWGVEADFGYTDISGSRTAPVAGFPTSVITETVESEWLSTIRGRLGITSGNFLIYATGGLAIAEVSYSDFISFTGSGTFNSASSNETRTGWTVGGGSEWAFDSKWSMKAEYLYVDLGDTSYTSSNSNSVAFPDSTIFHDHTLKEHIVRVGVNYRIN